MKKIILLVSFFASVFVLSQNLKDKQKVQLGVTLSTTDGNYKEVMPGIEISYGVFLGNKFELGLNIEHSRFNNIARDLSIYNTEIPNSEKESRRESRLLENKTINHSSVSVNGLYSLLDNEKHNVSIGAGVGLSIQDIVYQTGVEYTLFYSDRQMKEYDNVGFVPKNFYTLTILPQVNYNYKFGNQWFVGIGVKGQINVIEDKNFGKLYQGVGGGIDSLLRINFGIGKYF